MAETPFDLKSQIRNCKSIKIPVVVYWKHGGGPMLLRFTAAYMTADQALETVSYKVAWVCKTIAEAKRDVERLNQET